MKQYLYVKEYRNKLYCKWYNTITKKYHQEVYEDLPIKLDIYYVEADKKKNIYKTIDGYDTAKISYSNIKDYKLILRKFKDNDIPVFGVERIETVFIYKMFEIETEKLDFHIPRVLFYDIETDYNGIRYGIEEGKNAITLITFEDTDGNQEQWGWKSNNNKVYLEDLNYKHFQDEKTMLKAFYKKISSEIDILSAHNGDGFDDPTLYYRGLNIGLNPKAMSPFGIVREITKSGQYGSYKAIDIYGVEQLDTIHLMKKFLPVMSSYSLEYTSKEILGESGGKVDYSDEGTLVNLYNTNFNKFVKYGRDDTNLLYRINKKTSIIINAITLAYETLVNFSGYAGTVANYENFFAKMIWNGEI